MMLSIPAIRRELTSDILGRHIYLFGSGSAPMPVLRRLAETGAQQGTVVLTADEETKLSVAVLFRPHLTQSAVPLFGMISTLALGEAIGRVDPSTSPVWPDLVTVGDETVARTLIATPAGFDRPSYVILGAEVDVLALEASVGRSVDLNALDTWAMAYGEHGPAAVRAAVQFLPRGSMPASRAREHALGLG
jgi:hypothetical protein